MLLGNSSSSVFSLFIPVGYGWKRCTPSFHNPKINGMLFLGMSSVHPHNLGSMRYWVIASSYLFRKYGSSKLSIPSVLMITIVFFHRSIWTKKLNQLRHGRVPKATTITCYQKCVGERPNNDHSVHRWDVHPGYGAELVIKPTHAWRSDHFDRRLILISLWSVPNSYRSTMG